MRDLHIRPARFGDLAALTQSLGQEPYFRDRIDRQSRDLGVLLTAWHADRPVGDVYLWLEPAEELEIRTHLPNIPLLNHVEVHSAHRGLGIGTSLVLEAEQMLALRNHRRVALAVEATKPHLVEWYGRLGYREWPYSLVKCYSLSAGDGARKAETCCVLVKDLLL